MATHEDITEREELSARLQERNFQFDIAINLIDAGSNYTFVDLFTPVNGAFSGTLTAPTALGTSNRRVSLR